jgi:hypothetical protein
MSVFSVLFNPRPPHDDVFPVSVPLLRLLPDAIQYSDASAQFRRRNVVQQFVTKFEGGGADLFDDALPARREVNGFATPIVRCVFARDPAITLEPVQQRHQRRLYNPEMGRDLGLGHRTRRDGQMHKRSPFRLTQTHRLQPLIQFQPPGPGCPVQERTNRIDIVHGPKIVSMLTNSGLSIPIPAGFSVQKESTRNTTIVWSR